MKIGILTFHWATNYGAVLQAYALQKYLELRGHDVEVIDYKPLNEDISFRSIIKYPRILASYFKHYKTRVKQIRKDKTIDRFRKSYLHLSHHCSSYKEVCDISGKYDVLISGSDQVLNPSFTLSGEKHPTSTYYLTFDNVKLRLGYAISFGCEELPNSVKSLALDWIQSFDRIGYRENSASIILETLNYNKYNNLVPDPTVLMGTKLFEDIVIPPFQNRTPYTLLYLLHGHKISSGSCLPTNKIIDITKEARPASMERWLQLIKYSSYLVTNSYHGMIMAILFQVPFLVLLEQGSLSGMNDRFKTLLSVIGLENRIVYKDDLFKESFSQTPIDWDAVYERLSSFRLSGEKILNF